MSKRPNNLEAVTFSLKILHRIPRHPRTTNAPALLTQLREEGIDRSPRTIERHLENLCHEFGIICDDSSKPYRYSWPKEARALDIPVLSEQDSLLLLLAKQQLENLLPASLKKSMNGFFEQAEYALGAKPDSTLAREWLSKVRVVSETQPLIAPKVKSGVFEEVSNALYNNKWLNLEYQKPSGIQSTAEVMPLGLAQQGRALIMNERLPYIELYRRRPRHFHLIVLKNLIYENTMMMVDLVLAKGSGLS
jgi:predicted DNA-binding transcriptional regulator YafY